MATITITNTSMISVASFVLACGAYVILRDSRRSDVMCDLVSRISPRSRVRRGDLKSALDKTRCDTLPPSIVHSFFSVCCVCCAFALEGTLPDDDDVPYFLWESVLAHVALSVSLGYFVMDVIVVCRTRISGAVVIAHHLVCAATMASALVTGYGHFHICWLLLTEITTPFVDVRWLLDKTGKKDSPLYFYNGVALTATWVLARVLLFPPYFAFIFRTWEETDGGVCTVLRSMFVVVPTFLFALNLNWFWSVSRGMYKLVVIKKASSNAT